MRMMEVMTQPQEHNFKARLLNMLRLWWSLQNFIQIFSSSETTKVDAPYYKTKGENPVQ